MPITLYIASGLGFGDAARTLVLAPIVTKLKKMGYDVIEPFQDNNELDLARERTVALELEIARRDMQGVERADGLLCIVSNPIPDEGAMVEVGIALAWGKPIFILNDDFRYRPTGNTLPVNLMLCAGMNVDTWRSHYFTSIEDLSDSKKALAMWIQSVQFLRPLCVTTVQPLTSSS